MEICKWECNKSFDKELGKIKHYKIHPEMMPFVGKHYNSCKILLVGESHYVGSLDDEKGKAYLRDDNVEIWYNTPVPEDFSYTDWFNTRRVVHRFLINQRSKSYSIFRNPAKAIIEKWGLSEVSDSEAFCACAFMNYFQRPSLQEGDSIKSNKKDNEIAYKTLVEVDKVLEPEKIIFLSKKAFGAYLSIDKENSLNAEFTVHPTCSWWNKENGEEKFESIISEIQIKSNIFEKYTLPGKEDVKSKVKDLATVHDRRTFHNNITAKLCCSKVDSNEVVNEIIFYKIINEQKVEIGYNFIYKVLWVWDYGKKDYIDVKADKDESELTAFYEKVYNFITKLKV